MRLFMMLVICLAVVWSASACGNSSDGDGDADGDSDIDADADEDVDEGDAEADADEAADGDADEDADQDHPEGVRRGSVKVTQLLLGGDPSSRAYVSFGWWPDPIDSSCAVTEVAGCFALELPSCDPECPTGQFCDWMTDCSGSECIDVDWLPQFDVGEISITGGTHQGSIRCGYRPDEGDYSCGLDRDLHIWAAGDTLDVTAPGGELPPFSLLVSGPQDVVITNPDPAVGPAPEWNLAEDQLVEWESLGEADGATISLGRQALGTYRIYCDTEDDGSFTVPAEALSLLDPATTAIAIQVSLWNSSELNPDEDGEISATAATVSNSSARAADSP